MERVALSSPVLSTSSSSPTVLTYDGNALVLKWNKAANAVKYKVYLQFNDESHALEVNGTGSVITAELPAAWFDPTYTGQYLLRITPSDAYDNTGKSTSYYLMCSTGNAVYINGKTSESWENVSDLTKTKQFSIASSAAWTATADVPWITFDAASGVSSDMLSKG